MKISRFVPLLVLTAVASCKGVPELHSGICKMTTQSITDSGKSDQDKSEIRLLGISPAVGSPLLQGSLLTADLEYWVQDFAPGQYKILAQFALQVPNRSTDGDFPSAQYPILTSRAGRVHFCFPVDYVWTRPIQRSPFDVIFLLNRLVGETGKSLAVAQTEHLQFSASK